MFPLNRLGIRKVVRDKPVPMSSVGTSAYLIVLYLYSTIPCMWLQYSQS